MLKLKDRLNRCVLKWPKQDIQLHSEAPESSWHSLLPLTWPVLLLWSSLYVGFKACVTQIILRIHKPEGVSTRKRERERASLMLDVAVGSKSLVIMIKGGFTVCMWRHLIQFITIHNCWSILFCFGTEVSHCGDSKQYHYLEKVNKTALQNQHWSLLLSSSAT